MIWSIDSLTDKYSIWSSLRTKACSLQVAKIKRFACFEWTTGQSCLKYVCRFDLGFLSCDCVVLARRTTGYSHLYRHRLSRKDNGLRRRSRKGQALYLWKAMMLKIHLALRLLAGQLFSRNDAYVQVLRRLMLFWLFISLCDPGAE